MKETTIEERLKAILVQSRICSPGFVNLGGQRAVHFNPEHGSSLDDVLKNGKPIELVACPHPDDAEIGIGVYMAKYYGKINFVFVYVTSGSGSLITSKESEAAGLLAHKLFHKKPGDICTDEIRQKRFEQALDAMKAIGASAGIFFGYDSIKEPENSGRRENSISAASGIISLLKPQRIFVPQPCDQHLTHLLSTYIFASAATAAKTSAELLGYPVWAPAPYDEPTLKEFVMQEHVDAMRKAVRTHLTETVKDYAGAVEAMLRYDAIMCSNTPDAPENRYCLRLMRLNHLIGRSRGGIVRIIGSYVQDEKRKAEFDSQFDVK